MRLNKDNRIPELEALIKKAGATIMDIYNMEDRGISYKEDESPLTKADQAAHKIIYEGIRDLAPDYGFIGEENKNAPYSLRSRRDYNWMVDPLDGTKEFISRNGEFTVNIALIHQGRPVLGYVYIPAKDELFWASKNQGAWYLEPNSNQPQRLNASSFSWMEREIRVLCSRSHLNEETAAFLNHLEQPQQIAAGSALKFLRIAKGEAEVYPRLAPTMEWDTAAAEIVLIESGGQVLQWPELGKMDYNKKDLTNPAFVAFGQVDETETLYQIKKEMIA